MLRNRMLSMLISSHDDLINIVEEEYSMGKVRCIMSSQLWCCVYLSIIYMQKEIAFLNRFYIVWYDDLLQII